MKKLFNGLFNGTTIAFKLNIVFVFFMLLLVGTTAFSATMLAKAHETSESIFKNYGISQGYVGDMMGRFEMQRVYLSDVVLNPDSNALNGTTLKINAQNWSFKQDLENLRAACIDSQGVALCQNIENASVAFDKMRDDILAAAQTNLQKAGELLISDETKTSASDMELALTTAMNYLQNHATISLSSQKENVRVNTLLLCIVCGAALLVTFAVGILLNRKIGVPLSKFAALASQMAGGDLNLPVERDGKYEGKDEVVRISGAFVQVLGVFKKLEEDVSMLTDAAREGELSVRADASVHEGAFRDIVEGINKTLDAVIAPVEEASAVLNELALGNLNTSVQGEYEGDHAIIKNALNSTLEALR
ncbi:MAG TPA: MCP four helix bundle domain-containing protein, partial [Clostridia bacterium]|nr:MCP four helix bundle domain-containing protein [Clostridia bacterium]